MGIDVLQGYGATEMGPVVSFTRPERNGLGTVGEPIPGVEIRIADDGEILARGPGRFAGYWQNPEATAAAIDADGWYHTGDLGAITADGMLTLPRPQEGHARAARRPEGLPRGRRGDPARGRAAHRRGRRRLAAGADLRVHAVLLLDDRPRAREDVVRRRERAPRAAPADPRLDRLAGRRTCRGRTRSRCASPRSWRASPTLEPRPRRSERRVAAAAVPEVACEALDARWPTRSRSSIVAGVAGVSPHRSLPTRACRATSTSTRSSASSCSASSRRSSASSSTTTRSTRTRPSPTWSPLVDAARGAEARAGAWSWPLSPVVRAVGIAFQVLLMYPFVHALLPRPDDGPGAPRRPRRAGPASRRTTASTWTTRSSSAACRSRSAGSCRWRPPPTRSTATRSRASSPRSSRTPSRCRARARCAEPRAAGRAARPRLQHPPLPGGQADGRRSAPAVQGGAGLIAVEGGTPIVPVKLRINRMSIIDRRRWPRRSAATWRSWSGRRSGSTPTDHAAATTRLEAAVAAL